MSIDRPSSTPACSFPAAQRGGAKLALVAALVVVVVATAVWLLARDRTTPHVDPAAVTEIADIPAQPRSSAPDARIERSTAASERTDARPGEPVSVAPRPAAASTKASVAIRLLANGVALTQGRIELIGEGQLPVASRVDRNTAIASFVDVRPDSYEIAVDELPDGWVIQRIAARTKDYGGVPLAIEVRAGENTRDIELEAGATLTGSVFDENGWPVAGGALRISSLEKNPERFLKTRFVPLAAGTFRVSVHEGPYVLEADRSFRSRADEAQDLALARQARPLPQLADVRSGSVTNFEFRYGHAAETLVVVVVDEEGTAFEKLPIGVARMVPLGSPSDPSAAPVSYRQGLTHAKTDAAGRASFENLPAGDIVLVLEEKGRGPFDRPGESLLAHHAPHLVVTLPRADPEPLKLQYARARRVLVSGVVRTKVHGAVRCDAVLLPGASRPKEYRRDVRVDWMTGKFELHVDPTERQVTLEFYSADRRITRVVDLAPGANPPEVVVDWP